MATNSPTPLRTVDVTLGVAVSVGMPLWRAARIAAVPVRWSWALATEPPFVPHDKAPGRWIDAAERRGRAVRTGTLSTTADRLASIADVFVPAIATEVVRRIDVLALAKSAVPAEQIERELDTLVPYATAAILARIEPVTLIEANLSHEQVAKLLDLYLTEVTDQALRRLDLTAIVEQNVDLVDLTRGVLGHIDIVDLTTMVIAELDLATIANNVIEQIDLPDIIRESSSGVTGEAVDGARATAASADDFISGLFGRRAGRNS
jgi:hypothetical protein